MKNVDLNKLDLFCKLVDSGSFTKTAQLLKVPKSKISRQISALEEELQVQLIYRTTRQFQLTQNGKILYQNVKNKIVELQDVFCLVHEDREEISGLIRITCPEDIANEAMPSLCQQFLSLYPKVKFEFVISNDLLDLVKESIDVAIRISAPKDSTMKMRKLGHTHMIMVATEDVVRKWSLDLQTSKNLDILNQCPCISFSKLNHGNVWKLESKKEKKSIKVNAVVTSSHMLTIKQMAMAGVGVGMIPQFLCREELRSGKLIQVFPEWDIEGAVMHILTPQQKEKSPRIQVFVDFLFNNLKQHFHM